MDFLINFLMQAGLETGNPWSVLWWIFTHGGFIFVIWAFLKGGSDVWLNWRQNKYLAKLEQVYLAIDVPRNNEQSPKAVEQIFSHLWGAIKSPNFQEKWWDGYSQPNFSLELVSIEGYIQYIIRTPKMFRDLTEAAIYAQYPDAQITEIKDYTEDVAPQNFKEQGYNFWGAQFGLAEDEVFPIRTYPLFEHSITQQIVDPIAALLEIFSRMGKGEQAWMQIVIKPVGDDWKEKSAEKVKEVLGTTEEKKSGLIDKAIEAPGDLLTKAADVVFTPAGVEKKEEEPRFNFKMMNLSPGERSMVEGIDRKAEKTGFKAKIRYIYLVKNTKLVKTKGASGFVGALKQFALLNSNSFKSIKGTVTKSDIILNKVQASKIYKIQKKILKNYKSRTQWGGKKDYGDILNTEELASIYHFPYKEVVAPTLKAVEAKRAEAPMSLPIESEEDVREAGVSEVDKKAAPPENLPV